MRRKLSGYFLLSFLSFCFFTVVFLSIAHVEVSADQTAPKSTTNAKPVPTPTIYMEQAAEIKTQPVITTQLPSPTPTASIVQSQETTVQATTPTPELTDKITVTPTAVPTATPLPTETPVPSPTAASSPTQFAQPSQSDLEALFSQYSSTYNVSEDELKKIAGCESGFNTNSDSGYYTGMYQFSPSTWASVRGAMGLDTNTDLRKDPAEAIKTAAYMLSKGEENAWPNCH